VEEVLDFDGNRVLLCYSLV